MPDAPRGWVVVVDRQPRRLADQLQARGHPVRCVCTPRGLERQSGGQHVLLLVIADPPGGQLSLIRRIRAGTVAAVDPDKPVLAVAASRCGGLDALAAGADAAVRSARCAELAARVTAVLRRVRASQLRIGDLVVDLAARRALRFGADVRLSAAQWALLAVLGESPGRTFSKAELRAALPMSARELPLRAVDCHVQRLRRRLGPAGACLVTVWGIGYRLDPGQASTP